MARIELPSSFNDIFCMGMGNKKEKEKKRKKKTNKGNKWFDCMTAPVCYHHPCYLLPQTLSIMLSWSQNPIVRLINSVIKVNNLRKYYSAN